MAKNPTQSEINKRIKAVTMEGEFRFKCLELAAPYSKKLDDLFENASKIYNYSFHINPDAQQNEGEGNDN